jgi:hypothetical protein
LSSLREAFRILRARGTLVLTTPNAASLRNRARLLLGSTVYTPLSDWISGLPHARHAREYTTTELRELLVQAGFEVALLSGAHFHIRSGRRAPAAVVGKRAVHLLGRMRPSLGANLAVVARRP